VVDSLRLEDGVMVEHRDVIQDEATREGSAGGGACAEQLSRNEAVAFGESVML